MEIELSGLRSAVANLKKEGNSRALELTLQLLRRVEPQDGKLAEAELLQLLNLVDHLRHSDCLTIGLRGQHLGFRRRVMAGPS